MGLPVGGRKFAFRVKPRFPKSLTQEFLLVDLVNNLISLRKPRRVLKRVEARAASANGPRLRRAVREYGNERTKKFFGRVLTAGELHMPRDFLHNHPSLRT